MKFERHGLSIGIERTANEFYLTFVAKGKLSQEDYQQAVPMIEAALEQVDTPVVNALIDASQLEGIEAKAAWEDAKFGLKHGQKLNRVAVYGNKAWQSAAATVGNWFTQGQVKHFDNEDEAVNWVFSAA